MTAWIRTCRLAVRYRIERDAARRRGDQLERELRTARVDNMQLTATLRQMDATNAALARDSAARAFQPVGRFVPWF